ncbi:MAG: sensor histidine kinase [Clostridiaceae bacterium]|nr:sensor histidine kinase [Clostridiaceae bacterium]
MKKILSDLLKSFRKISIKTKLVLLLTTQILIPLVLVGFLSYKNSEGIIKENSTDYSRDILHMIRLRLDDYLDNLIQISQDLLYEEKIYEVLKSSGNIQDPLRIYEIQNSVNSHLKMMVISRPEIRSICIYSNDGRMFYQDDNTREAGSRSDLPYEKMFAQARKENGKPSLYVVADENKRAKDVYMIRQINDRDDFDELGLLIMHVRKELFDEVYQGLTGNLENIMILSPDMELVASRNIVNPNIMESMLNEGISGYMGEKIDEKAGMFISYITQEMTGWKIVSYVRLDVLYKDARTLRNNIIMLCIAAVIVLSAVTLVIAVNIVKPINKLVNGMKKVQEGEGNVQIEVDREDELGFLQKTFNEMSGEIHHLVNWVYREQLTRKEAELKALQSQINPHFLFNTLEAINWMAQLNNVPEISETVSDLSDLMEASIGRDDRLITLEEEFQYADKYISLQKRRFGDKIELIKNVQPDVLGIEIPRLLIQPLIENAVYHGIERNRGRGTITLNAYRDKKGCLCVEVIDNGAGMEPEELEELNARLTLDNNAYFRGLGGNRRKSIGIENVNRRIKLFYGEQYGLKMESMVGEFTKVTIRIPCEVNMDNREGFYVQGSDSR